MSKTRTFRCIYINCYSKNILSAKNCKKDTIFDNLKTITQEVRRHENHRNDPIFFISFSSPNCLGNSFLHLKIARIYFHEGTPFNSFWSAKYLNFGVESCEIRILSRSIQETYTLRKVRISSKIFRVI